MCGSGLTVHMKSGEAVRIMDSEVGVSGVYHGSTVLTLRQASLIPPAEDIEGFEVEEDLAWVLVVEKEVRKQR